MKIITYRVRDVEVPIFEKINKQFGHELKIIPGALNADTVKEVDGYDCLIVRATDKLNADLLTTIKNYGVKYLLTRTVGYDHIDLDAAHKLGFKMARVPSYSPTAIAELAFGMAIMLSRKILYFANNATHYDLTAGPEGFAVELKNKTVGIIGTGKIGLATAKMFTSMTNNILAYDPYPSDEAKKICKFVSLDQLLMQSDIISIHVPYFKGENDKMINTEFFNKMKKRPVVVNAARGQIQCEDSILTAIESNQIESYACDVINNESKYFFKKIDCFNEEVLTKLIALYPRFIMTPHIGSYTDEAVLNMVELTYENLEELINTGKTKNSI